jgi:hypothetical protein
MREEPLCRSSDRSMIVFVLVMACLAKIPRRFARSE